MDTAAVVHQAALAGVEGDALLAGFDGPGAGTQSRPLRNQSTERDVSRLLAHAQLGLDGTALGRVLPEERLTTVARWTAKSLDVVRAFDDRALTTTALRMHGNELRKAGLFSAAVQRATVGPLPDAHDAATHALTRLRTEISA
ncbi:hypothetical protein ABZW47_29480 [Streptomyces sp. NPDC004549]|uniref:hypothetical protein n=1 Tax=Streptomyces sp. NPDC004549 TaxID=3154283 RepID=UPI0033A017FC